ncbi:Uncharacterized protein Adt_39845 [Abeliophyllum distichum]|uniref:Secreted protein n=1 Tax=Abeliophyllum distichum TaxID=126358 RepID=A0ABD1Q683_9LAMI
MRWRRCVGHDPWAFYLHATLLCQAFAHFESSPMLLMVGVCAVSSCSVADHPFRSVIDHRLGNLLPYQLVNRMQAPPRLDSSFCTSTYMVLATASNCCFHLKDMLLRVTHSSATGNITYRPTCMY